MKDNQENEQNGMDTNFDSNRQNEVNPTKKNQETSTNSAPRFVTNEKQEELREESNESITRKEHDDTNHDHEYITPGNQTQTQQENQNQSSKKLKHLM